MVQGQHGALQIFCENIPHKVVKTVPGNDQFTDQIEESVNKVYMYFDGLYLFNFRGVSCLIS